jgi:hypothetical protein
MSTAVPPPVPTPAPPPVEHLHPHRRVALLGARLLAWVVYAYVLVTEAILGLGFLLLLFGANPDASFVAWAYRSLDRAMEPFRGMFTPIDLGLSGSQDVGAVLDTSVLFAMIVYAVLAWLISCLLGWLTGFLDRLDAADAATAHPGAPPPPPPARSSWPPASGAVP